MTNPSERNQDLSQLSLDLDLPVVIEQLPGLPSARRGTAAASRIRYKTFGQLTFADLEIFNSVPDHPTWSQVERLIDFSFADDLCAFLYSPNGQRPIAPSLKLKAHLVQAMDSLSDRQLEDQMIYNIAIKRFLGVPMSFAGFDHSTVGLDRDRMGPLLFHACFHYILAQAKAKGLWGGRGDRWFIDTFHTHARAARMGAQQLVFHGLQNFLKHLERTHPSLFAVAAKRLHLTDWFEQSPASVSDEDALVAFSLLVSRAYALLSWFDCDEGRALFWQWTDRSQQLRSLELQAILLEILQQNTRPVPPDDPKKKTDVAFEKIPRPDRPKDRIVNAHDPELRNGHKTINQPFCGDKIEVLVSDDSGFILEIEPIPGNEPDGERMTELASRVVRHHETAPKHLVADSAYGLGKYREEAANAQFHVIAPLRLYKNPTGLFGNERFHYDPDQQQVTCPSNHTTVRKVRNNVEKGYQFLFDASVCALCPQREACTTSKSGRTIFVSDYYQIYEEAKKVNQTEEAQEALRSRFKIERTNNELANHHDMRRPQTRGRDPLRMAAKLKGIAVNVKLMVKKLVGYKEDPFVRRPRRPRDAAACS